MSAVLGLNSDIIEKALIDKKLNSRDCNLNSPQTVIAGNADEIESIETT